MAEFPGIICPEKALSVEYLKGAECLRAYSGGCCQSKPLTSMTKEKGRSPS